MGLPVLFRGGAAPAPQDFDAAAIAALLELPSAQLLLEFPAAALSAELALPTATMTTVFGATEQAAHLAAAVATLDAQYAAAAQIQLLELAAALLATTYAPAALAVDVALPVAQAVMDLVFAADAIAVEISLPSAQLSLPGAEGHGMYGTRQPIHTYIDQVDVVAFARPTRITLTLPPARVIFERRYDAYDLAVAAGELDEDWR